MFTSIPTCSHVYIRIRRGVTLPTSLLVAAPAPFWGFHMPPKPLGNCWLGLLGLIDVVWLPPLVLLPPECGTPLPRPLPLGYSSIPQSISLEPAPASVP